MSVTVLDLSDYQPDATAATPNIGGVILKITEAMSCQGATHAATKAAATRACGYPVAGYHFARPGDPAAQAQWAAQIAGRLGISTVFVDCEVAGVSSAFADAFCACLEGFGLRAGVYVSPGFAAGWGTPPSTLATRPLWVADYFADYAPDHPWPAVAPWPAASGWQYTDVYSASGVHTDASVFDPAELAAWTGADDMTPEQAAILQGVANDTAWLKAALVQYDGEVTSGPTANFGDKLMATLDAIATKVAALSTGGVDVEALADAIVAKIGTRLDQPPAA